MFDDELHFSEDVVSFWTLLGVKADLLQEFGRLNPRWRDGLLYISERFKTDDIFERIACLVTSTWSFRPFTKSRWLTIGIATRSLVAAQLLGFDEIVRLARADKHASEHWLHHYDRFNVLERRYCILCALASAPSDGQMEELMLDDRVALRLPELQQRLTSDLEDLDSISDHHWKRMVETLGGQPEEHWFNVRSDALEIAQIASSHFADWCLDVALKPPWSLCRGDPIANLRELAESDEDGDLDVGCSFKLVELFRLGYSHIDLISIIVLIGNFHWTSISVEQLHASLGVIHRYHNLYSAEMVVHRAFIHACRAFLAQPPHVRKTERLQKSLDRLDKKNPNMMRANNQIIADFVRCMKSRLDPSDMRPLPFWQHIFSLGSHGWTNLTLDEREIYERDVELERPVAHEKLDLEKESIASMIVLIRRRFAVELVATPCHFISKNRLTESELNLLLSSYESSVAQPSMIADWRAATAESPRELEGANLKTLLAQHHEVYRQK